MNPASGRGLEAASVSGAKAGADQGSGEAGPSTSFAALQFSVPFPARSPSRGCDSWSGFPEHLAAGTESHKCARGHTDGGHVCTEEEPR